MAHTMPVVAGVVCMDDRPKRDDHRPRFSQNQTYVQALAAAGAAPLLIPLLEDEILLRALYERLDGVLLPGGDDVHPDRYGEPVHERCGAIDPVRDQVEITLTRWAMGEGKPVLAICRGIQVLNVALGGTLYQDIEAQVPDAGRHDWHSGHARDFLAHIVAVSPGSRLAALSETSSLPVNSLHHQAVRNVAPGLTVVARTPDGLVEALEAENHPFMLAVQWHPEELAAHDARARRLFSAFVDACRAQRA